MNEKVTESSTPTCFMAMPITTNPDHAEKYGDRHHWTHVMESLFEAAIREAGFEPARPIAKGSHLIHGQIIERLSSAELVLVDLSSHNPNVFFELGVRTSLNLPIALVRDEHTELPFDTSGINTHTYDSNLRGWEMQEEQRKLAEHIRDSHASCGGQNPLWRQFGLTIKAASEPDANESPLEAKVDLLMSRFEQFSHYFSGSDAHRQQQDWDQLRREVDGVRSSPRSRKSLRLRSVPAPVEVLIDELEGRLGPRAPILTILGPHEVVAEWKDRNVTLEDRRAVQDLADRYGVSIEGYSFRDSGGVDLGGKV